MVNITAFEAAIQFINLRVKVEKAGTFVNERETKYFPVSDAIHVYDELFGFGEAFSKVL